MRRLAFRCGLGVWLPLAVAATHTAAQELPQPTNAHKQMAREAGVWDGEAQVWMAPGAPPEKSACSETCEMLGGFWLVSDFQGEFAGTPFTGQSQLGYEPETGEFVSTWVDSMAPALFVSRGKYDVATHTLTLLGEGKDWMTGEAKETKLVIQYVDDDHKNFEVHERPTGADEWRRSMRVEYVRRK